MFDTTPTTVTHGPGRLSSKKRRRLPTGSSPCQYRLANNSFTIATGPADATSASLNSRPERNAALSVRKYVGLIVNTDSVGRLRSAADGTPASSYAIFDEPQEGSVSVVATD